MPDTAKRLLRLSITIFAGVVVMLSPESGPARVYAQTGGSKKNDKKEILIKTPWGGLEASATPDPARLRLPIYPGAKFVKDGDSNSFSFDLSVKGKPDVHFLVGKFETPDGIEKVRDFYQKNLGKAVTKFLEKTDEGGIGFEMRGASESRFVQLKSFGGRTQIDLLRIEGLEVQDKGEE